MQVVRLLTPEPHADLDIVLVLALVPDPEQLTQHASIQPGVVGSTSHGVRLARAGLAVGENAHIVASALGQTGPGQDL